MYRHIPGTRVLLVLTYTSINHRFICKCKDRLFTIIDTPNIIIVPDIVVDLCLNLFFNEARPTERSDRGRCSPIRQNASSYRGAYRLTLFNLSVCLSVSCVCVTFVVFTDCESCTRPISTNPRSMEAGEYGLTRGTCFVARRLEVIAVAGLLWISWCVLGAAGFRVFFSCFFFVFLSSNAHDLLQV